MEVTVGAVYVDKPRAVCVNDAETVFIFHACVLVHFNFFPSLNNHRYYLVALAYLFISLAPTTNIQ